MSKYGTVLISYCTQLKINKDSIVAKPEDVYQGIIKA
jgi:hypothetical protein